MAQVSLLFQLKKQVASLKLFSHIAVANQKTKRGVITLLKGVTMGEGCPEFDGYKTRLCGEQRTSPFQD